MRLHSFLILFACFGLGCERLETVESNYATYDAAVDANAIGDQKWLPALLPKSSTEISEVHNLDTNETWVRFKFMLKDLPRMTETCSRQIASEIRLPRKAQRDWWHESLQSSNSSNNSRFDEFELYKCSTRSYLAVLSDKETAYFWELSQ